MVVPRFLGPYITALTGQLSGNFPELFGTVLSIVWLETGVRLGEEEGDDAAKYG